MNWGWKLAIVYTTFVVAVMTFVFKARSEKIDLVAQDYYVQELRFKERMEAASNANAYYSSISVKRKGDVIWIQLPQEQVNSITEAHVHFYCPSDADKDVELQLQLDENALATVPVSLLKEGNYLAKLSWLADDKNHYIEKKVTIK